MEDFNPREARAYDDHESWPAYRNKDQTWQDVADEMMWEAETGLWLDLEARGPYTIAIEDEDGEWLAEATGIIGPPIPDGISNDTEWKSPHHIVGGLKENPGVFGSGGGVVITEIDPATGVTRTTHTWDQGWTGTGEPVETERYTKLEDSDDYDAIVEWMDSYQEENA